MKIIHIVALIILVLGGLSVGLSAFGVDALAAIFGVSSTAEYIVRILIGLAAILFVVTHKGSCKMCTASTDPIV